MTLLINILGSICFTCVCVEDVFSPRPDLTKEGKLLLWYNCPETKARIHAEILDINELKKIWKG